MRHVWQEFKQFAFKGNMIELAVAGSASAIVTKNARDFRSAELHFPGLRILLPEEVLQEI